jgi:hypothetical protein
LRDVAVPVGDLDLGLYQEVVQAKELVVDECFGGADVEDAY